MTIRQTVPIVIAASKVYAMLGNESLWDAAHRSHARLSEAGVAHAILGGVAVCLHGYQRNTIDLDLLVRKDESLVAKSVLESNDWQWIPDRTEFQSPSGVLLHFLSAGDKAGPDSEVRLPDPADAASVIEREGLPVLTLSRLIETKLASGQGNLRRTHKDFADVVELIAANSLGRDFARHLHKSLRATFRELVMHARGGG